MEILWTGFVIGLIGSAHCAGMCGPIAIALPGRDAPTGRLVTGRLLYNFGRIISYMIIGLGAGLIGLGATLAVSQQILSIVTGVMILVIALLPGIPFKKFLHFSPNWIYKGSTGKLFSRLIRSSKPSSLLGLGVLNGFLPCGFVYIGVAGSVSMGSIWGSVAYMGLFGLGTVPIMLALSLSPAALPQNLKLKLQKMLPAVAGVLGVLLILRGLSLGIPFISPDMSMGLGTEMCH